MILAEQILAELKAELTPKDDLDYFDIVADLNGDNLTVTIFFTYIEDDDFAKTVTLSDPKSLSDLKDWMQYTVNECMITLID